MNLKKRVETGARRFKFHEVNLEEIELHLWHLVAIRSVNAPAAVGAQLGFGSFGLDLADPGLSRSPGCLCSSDERQLRDQVFM